MAALAADFADANTRCGKAQQALKRSLIVGPGVAGIRGSGLGPAGGAALHDDGPGKGAFGLESAAACKGPGVTPGGREQPHAARFQDTISARKRRRYGPVLSSVTNVTPGVSPFRRSVSVKPERSR